MIVEQRLGNDSADRRAKHTASGRSGERALFMPNPELRLQEQLHEVMRFFHYSPRTEETYWHWIVRFLRFHRDVKLATLKLEDESRSGSMSKREGWRHPREMGAAEVSAFLSDLATRGKVSAATQNQALNALVFLYAEVLHQPLGDLGEVARVTRPARVPEVLGRAALGRLLDAVEADYQLPVRLLYGSGLRLLELLRLRVKDVDLARRQIIVREGKGMKDRVTMLPGGTRLKAKSSMLKCERKMPKREYGAVN